MQAIVCPRCNGKGKSVRIRERDHISAPWYSWLECAACRGTGYQMNNCFSVPASIAPLYEQVISLASCLPLGQPAKKTTAKRLSLVTRL